jgi:hypothetical protein
MPNSSRGSPPSTPAKGSTTSRSGSYPGRRSAAAGIPAPHHGHGVNPCAPSAYDNRPLPEKHIEEAMNRTFEAADTLGANTGAGA